MSGCSTVSISDYFGGDDAGRDAEAQVTEAGDVDAFELQVGDCLLSADLAEEFSEVPAVPCDQPHDTEVMRLFDVSEPTFDDVAIAEAADEQCASAIESYVGPNWVTILAEDLTYGYLAPTQESWSSGDREIVCLAQTVSGASSLTSTVKGTGQ
ncbi:MAG: septum formation family protein [Propionibacteriaceae bacterium]|jgi:hypothetical protein|nr:septum formation family protein [Propionibacteriaceae bacterium]